MTLTTQFYTLITMIALGSVFGASLDTYNRFLNRSKRKSWLVFINDIFFWLCQALFIFYVLFHVNQGELRFYIFIALFCGFAAYQSLLKVMYLKGLELIISAFISIYHVIVKVFLLIIYHPLKWIVTMLISITILISKGLWSLVFFLGKTLLFITRLILKPFLWLMKLLWKILPKNIKKIVERLYNKLEGFLSKVEKLVNRFILWCKKRKE